MAGLNDTLKRTTARSKMRIGRGGTRGKTSGRGTKGQSARAGNKKRPEWRDIIKKLPKRRGFGKNRARTVVGARPDAITVSLGRLNTLFENGAEVTVAALVEKKAVQARGGKLPLIKVVNGGEFSKKLTIKGCPITASARASIEKVGGSVV